MTLAGKVIVITGASSGFGELIARRCAAAGALVVLAARSATSLHELATQLGHQRTLVVPTDVTDQAACVTLATQTYDRFGHADILLNNAGFGILDAVEHGDPADLQQMFAVNVLGALHCTQAFAPHMRTRRRGQIVMMASAAGFIPTANMGYYTATKHALVGLSRTLMLELAGSGVRCALICPGVAQTGFQRNAEPAKFARSTRLSTVTPERVADVTLAAFDRNASGEIFVPRRLRLLMWGVQVIPGIARRITQVLDG